MPAAPIAPPRRNLSSSRFLSRPDIHGASALSLLGTALAAVTDFAPLGVWSASADEDGLRLPAYDGAVRLFELHLARYPASPFAAWAGEARKAPYQLQGTAAALLPPAYRIKDREVPWTGLAISAAGFVGLQISYTLAFQDAQRGALPFNEGMESRFRAAHPCAP